MKRNSYVCYTCCPICLSFQISHMFIFQHNVCFPSERNHLVVLNYFIQKYLSSFFLMCLHEQSVLFSAACSFQSRFVGILRKIWAAAVESSANKRERWLMILYFSCFSSGLCHSLFLCPWSLLTFLLYSSHLDLFLPILLLSVSLFLLFSRDPTVRSACSGPAGSQCRPEHFRAAQTHKQQSPAFRPWRHQLPDVHLWRPGAGAQRPG